MVLYSKFAYGSQFSEEKNDLTILHLVAKILGKNPVSFFLGRPVVGSCLECILGVWMVSKGVWGLFEYLQILGLDNLK